MTYEEARNLIDEMRAEIKAKHMCRSMDGECSAEEVTEYRCRFAALSMAIEALEKQIPKKPKFVKIPNTSFTKAHLRCECPMCGNLLMSGCGCDNNDCGQRIDWSE